MKLNLGCWKFKIKDWINIDIDHSVNPDVIMDATKLEYPDNSIEEIYAGHLLEHLTMREGGDALNEWKRVLIPGGLCTITVPDVEKLLCKYSRKETDISFVNLNVFGAQDREQQNHHMVFTEGILKEYCGLVFPMMDIIPDSPLAPFHVDWQTIIQCKK